MDGVGSWQGGGPHPNENHTRELMDVSGRKSLEAHGITWSKIKIYGKSWAPIEVSTAPRKLPPWNCQWKPARKLPSLPSDLVSQIFGAVGCSRLRELGRSFWRNRGTGMDPNQPLPLTVTLALYPNPDSKRTQNGPETRLRPFLIFVYYSDPRTAT